MVRGEALTRPLLLAKLFALGSRMENLPLRDYLGNPTKITNALRQIRAALKVDGVMCYCDPYLEAEALGGRVEWSGDESRTLTAPVAESVGALRRAYGEPGGILKMGRIGVAVEALRRLKTMLKDEPALMLRVTGPYTLGEQLRVENQDRLIFAAEIIATLVKEYLEAGADVIFLEESALPRSGNEGAAWKSALDPITNMIRFYEALPVLRVETEDISVLAEQSWDCALCIDPSAMAESDWSRTTPWLGVDLALAEPGSVTDLEQTLQCLSGARLKFVSCPDLPRAMEMKSLTRILTSVRERLASATVRY
jgi:hypothetical protein